MTLVDAKARDRALDPSISCIVQAPAGSGKTGLLVRRVLTLLCVVDKPEQILAITFTRKATAEMRERILSALSKAEKGEPFEAHEQDMLPRAKAVLERDKQQNWQLSKYPQRLKIQTIDALCAELVRKMPWSARFGGMPQIETDVATLYTQAAQNLVTRIETTDLQAPLTCLLQHANGDVTALTQQLANSLYQRESWLRLLFSQGALASQTHVETSWKQLIEDALIQMKSALGPVNCQALIDLQKYAHGHLSHDEISLDNKNESISVLEAEIKRWRSIMPLLLIKDGSLRKAPNRAIGFPNKDDAKQRLVDILLNLSESPEIVDKIAHFNDCPDPEISDQQWAKFDAVRTVLPALVQELTLLMSQSQCADYTQLSLSAIDALGEEQKPTQLALIQDYQLSHILMDEFQDTSQTQLTLLKRLTAGWQMGDGRSLFFVGDPMQSIYRFRQADSRIFSQLKKSGLHHVSLASLQLSVNFRSSPQIIDWVNKSMKPIFARRDGEVQVRYSPSTAHFKTQGSVHRHLCIASKLQFEIDQIVMLINDIHTTDPSQEIAVLARKRAPLALLAKSLREKNMMFEAVELELLSEQEIVQDLISLTAIFVQPFDSLAWLCVLRAPWCGLSLADLTQLQSIKTPVMMVMEDLNLVPLSQAGQQQLARLRDAIYPLFQSGRSESLVDKSQKAWLRLRGPACYPNHAMAHAQHYFDKLQSLGESNQSISKLSLMQVCTQTKVSSSQYSLKLMTIHKAKGLEFDRVILCGMSSRAGGDMRQSPLLLSGEFDNQPLAAVNALANEDSPTKAGYIRQQHTKLEEQEAARLLYVALTRAKRHLHLFATLKRNNKNEVGNPPSGSLLSLLWPEQSEAFINSADFKEEVLGDETSTLVDSNKKGVRLRRLSDELLPIVVPPNIDYTPIKRNEQKEPLAFDWAKEDARLIGLAMHQLLEHADIDLIKSWQVSIDTAMLRVCLVQVGMASERIDRSIKQLETMLKNMAQDDRAHWLFDPRHNQVQTEWAISCVQDNQVMRYLIDRSFIDAKGIRWVVDFKTSTHQGGGMEKFVDQQVQRYTSQLNRYGTLVRGLEAEREIWLGLYFPALKAWREWPF